MTQSHSGLGRAHWQSVLLAAWFSPSCAVPVMRPTAATVPQSKTATTTTMTTIKPQPRPQISHSQTYCKMEGAAAVSFSDARPLAMQSCGAAAAVMARTAAAAAAAGLRCRRGT